jgi:transcriptional regulator with XRE-family HTH domain
MATRNGRIRDLRAEQGWSQEVLARRAGVSLGTVNRAELGLRIPTVMTQERIARALGVKRRELWPELDEVAS